MRDQILRLYESTRLDAHRLLAEVPDARWAEQPYPDAKHPAWVLGHLCLGSGMIVGCLTGDTTDFGGMPAEWTSAFAPGAPIRADRDAYPAKTELLDAFDSVHRVLADAFRAAPDNALAREFPNPDYRSFFPTVADAAIYIMAHHEGYHLGQLSQWRRAAGFGPSSVDE